MTESRRVATSFSNRYNVSAFNVVVMPFIVIRFFHYIKWKRDVS